MNELKMNKKIKITVAIGVIILIICSLALLFVGEKQNITSVDTKSADTKVAQKKISSIIWNW